MKTKNNLPLILMGGLGLVCLFSGCSVIGFGIGAIKDDRTPKSKNVLISQIGELKTNDKIELVLKNGSHIQGKYAGRVFIEVESYSEKYEKSRNQLRGRIVLPEIGDSVRVEFISQSPDREFLTGKFLRFDFEKVDVPDPPLRLIIEHLSGNQSWIPMKDLKTISDFKGNILLKEALINLIENGEVPCLSYKGIMVLDKNTLHEIRIEDISQIRILPFRGHKWFGLVLGGIFDSWMIYQLSQPWDLGDLKF